MKYSFQFSTRLPLNRGFNKLKPMFGFSCQLMSSAALTPTFIHPTVECRRPGPDGELPVQRHLRDSVWGEIHLADWSSALLPVNLVRSVHLYPCKMRKENKTVVSGSNLSKRLHIPLAYRPSALLLVKTIHILSTAQRNKEKLSVLIVNRFNTILSPSTV